MKKMVFLILMFVCMTNASNILTTTIGNTICPKPKNGWCSDNKISASYNWKTGRGRISWDWWSINDGVSVKLVGYDADGMYLGTILEIELESTSTGWEFNEIGNELDETLRKDVRKVKLQPSDTYQPYITGCNDGFTENDDGKCKKPYIPNGKNRRFQPYGSPYYGKLPENCWGDPLAHYWCD
jgi:hypothetical protein